MSVPGGEFREHVAYEPHHRRSGTGKVGPAQRQGTGGTATEPGWPRTPAEAPDAEPACPADHMSLAESAHRPPTREIVCTPDEREVEVPAAVLVEADDPQCLVLAMTLVEVRNKVEPVPRRFERPPARPIANRVPAPALPLVGEEAVELAQIASIEGTQELIETGRASHDAATGRAAGSAASAINGAARAAIVTAKARREPLTIGACSCPATTPARTETRRRGCTPRRRRSGRHSRYRRGSRR